ncbi:dTDP-4-amino-4,6-dideoxygalactose transaminase [Flavobacterium sp. GT3R68]|uniref:dTDP-4-amino-4,6-dideoxygalactose transaminase n=1 Tax=Flavobacterium sp. GT3R68 TaxID=2594437 RepID=UPI000F887AE5|nr:dTDP-4-amino-4,6-dideoxygalactose transaminase [Flavobacterium sp. GT3R68]RTY92306.1 dTDP-4-amino-4,6-dideoxygalactose transaminase [Flavobacterium sp. GSN2]TRW92542.1 dTDP-4-amino-4,6-dideoxygalactose transaminase [Flavobacterium sp. GT3R68]
MIPFNKVYITGKESIYINETLNNGAISGNGYFTKLCQGFFEAKYGFKKTLLATSCTDALEMCAILANIKTDDEVIIPSYTFVSTALPFIRQGAKIIFADSYIDNPNIDVNKIETLITSKTKAIVIVHYAGVSCDMDAIMALAKKYDLLVIEDAAQAIDSFYTGKDGVKRPLGSIGHLAAFSFHETKNIVSGEGGMLVINEEQFINRAEVIWEKGTNRAEFYRGEVNKYGWVDTGSSFLPSEIIAAFLWGQLENLDKIQAKRILLWNAYYDILSKIDLKGILLPKIPSYAYNNGHMFYIVARDIDQRNQLIATLKENGFHAVFHYLSLHDSSYYRDKHDGRILENSDKFTNCLLRLPLFYELEVSQIQDLVNKCF